MFKDRFETKSAGLFNENPVDKKQINWADLIVVMEEDQRKEIGKRFPEEYLDKRIVSLDIPDIFSFNQPELKNTLKEKIKKVIKN